MSNELRLDMARYLIDPTQDLPGLQAPYGASSVNAAGADEVGVHFVPVEGGQRGAEVRVLVVVEHALEQSVGLARAPDAQVVA